jgi:transcriptional/translational regulatory protein YebC/TACO1
MAFGERTPGHAADVPDARPCRYHTRYVFARGGAPAPVDLTMAGYSKWANIQRGASARARRVCQGPKARPGEDLARVRYEGYGPGGAAVLVECMTADPGRMAAEVRRTFVEYGGQLGADGAVSYLFNTVGLMTYPPGTDERPLVQAALDAGAEEVVPHADHSVEVLADPAEFAIVRAALTERGFTPATAEITQRAATSLELSGETAEAMVHLLEALEALADVRHVYANVEIANEVLARL